MQLRMSLVFSSCKGTLLAHVQAGVKQHLQVHFCQADLQVGDHQCILVRGTFTPQVQDFALPFVEPYGVPDKLSGSLHNLAYQPLLLVLCHLGAGLRVHSAPSPRSLMTVLRMTGPCVDPWDASLVTGLQLDFEPLITTVSA